MSRQIYHDPFSIETLAKLPSLLVDPSAVWDGFIFDNSLESNLLQLSESEAKALPELQPALLALNLDSVPLQGLSTPPSASSETSSNEFFEVQEHLSDEEADNHGDDDATNIWTLPEISKRSRKSRLICWDNFLNEKHKELQSGYLSEVSPMVFSTIVNRPATNSLKLVKSDVLLNATFELSMGRSSGLFNWNESKGAFEACWDNLTAIGYSGSLLRNTIAIFSNVGTGTRKLVELFKDLDMRGHKMLPSTIALISSVRSALFVIHKHLEDIRAHVSSLLQLRNIIDKVKTLIHVLSNLCNVVKTLCSDQEVILCLMQEASIASVAHSGLDAILQVIFTQVTRPGLEKLSSEIGLTSTLINNHSPDLMVDEEDYGGSWLSLLSAESSQLISQTRQSLHLLRQYAPQALVFYNSRSIASSTLTLQPVYSYLAICQQQKLASEYESTLKLSFVAPESGSLNPSSGLTLTQCSWRREDASTVFSEGPFTLNLDLFGSHMPKRQAELEHEVTAYLNDCHMERPEPFQLQLDQALVSSVAPALAAQHRLLSYSILQILFEEHNLLAHINLQRNFHLFGHPTFPQRLTMALFDPNQTSGEGKRLTGSYTGLRLQARDTWPPAGSELRLVLMGILSDSLACSDERSFESSISFAIRDMPLDELEKCREVNSIHALRFLRLQYKAPNHILESVLSPSILDKYDRVFQHLLLILRLHSVTEGLLRDNCSTRDASKKNLLDQKLILEMHHFISMLADYCQNTAINLCWEHFDGILEKVKGLIERKDYDNTLKIVKSQDFLKTLLEQTLDDTLHAMLLRKKQARGLQLLHGMFNLILEFAASKRSQTEASESKLRDYNDEPTMRRYNHDFKTHMTGLIEMLKAQSQYRPHQKVGGIEGFGIGSSAADNPVDHLLLKLDMFGYWSSGRRKGIFASRLPTMVSDQ
ncbi:uncharacterized protein A1O9_06298 [Exophiala aquamarina CBS 119918]|uniref:Spindle pole body component n=1 Tax=Exophiala aquamarina CBS 119918 TaxID=1182545 RepID=A0A072PF46_9EURO|nr:uncharacterized protein A1O9_06298 [Exophiala aquamarina CBS 119918]KEF58372.1 hypothetical protein A1O9_06298 [Exophiala aquamarina CBS 119918]